MKSQTEEWITVMGDVKIMVWRFIDNETDKDIYLDLIGSRGGFHGGRTLTPAQARQLARNLIEAAQKEKA